MPPIGTPTQPTAKRQMHDPRQPEALAKLPSIYHMHPNVQTNHAAMSQQCADVPSQNVEATVLL